MDTLSIQDVSAPDSRPAATTDENDDGHKAIHEKEHHDELLEQMASDKEGIPFFSPNLDHIVYDDVEKKIQEDKRLDFLLRMQKTLNQTYDNPGFVHPHGMSEYDYTSVPEYRKPGLEDLKMRTRRENYIYLKAHPELDAMMSLLIQNMLKLQPMDPVRYAAEFFTMKGTSFPEFSKLLEEETKKLTRHRTTGFKGGKTKFGGKEDVSYKDVNDFKLLNLGPFADLLPPPPAPVEIAKPPTPPPPPPPPPIQISQKKFYCGCKDPGRRERAHLKIESTKPMPEPVQPDFSTEWEWEGEEYETDDIFKLESVSSLDLFGYNDSNPNLAMIDQSNEKGVGPSSRTDMAL